MFLFFFFPPTFHTQKLDLHNNELTGEGAKAIATGLVEGGGMPCLDELYLGFNRLGDDGARYDGSMSWI